MARPIHDDRLFGLVVGTVLCLDAFVTNPVPDPSFRWANAPATSMHFLHTASNRALASGLHARHLAVDSRFPVVIPRGVQTNRTADARRLNAVARRAAHHRDARLDDVLSILWPKVAPPTWNAPSYTIVCWKYCSSYEPIWRNLAYGIILIGLIATVLGVRRATGGRHVLLGFGLVALPLGLPAVFEGSRRTRWPITRERGGWGNGTRPCRMRIETLE